MTEHFTRNTEEATHWCNKCRSHTQHKVSAGKLAHCLQCTEPQPTLAQVLDLPPVHILITHDQAGSVSWRCQCNAHRTCTGGPTWGPRSSKPTAHLTPLQEAHYNATLHVEKEHQGCSIIWQFPNPEGAQQP